MPQIESRILEVLLRYMSEPAAKGVVRRAQLQRSRHLHRSKDSAGAFLNEIIFGAQLFANDASGAQIERDLRGLQDEEASRVLGASESLPICDEHHARRARMTARRLAETAGAGKLASLRAATGLSELTRNILMYAGTGSVTIEIVDHPRRIRMVAQDSGPGIPDVELVLGGHYRSKTGLGRGLQGTRKLADHFEIETGPTGTTVTFEMHI